MDPVGVRHRLVEHVYYHGAFAYKVYCGNYGYPSTVPMVEKDNVITCLYCVAI